MANNLPWSEVTRHLNEWSQTMKISGYSAKERFEAIRGAVLRKEEMERKLKAGEITSLNRNKEEIIRMKAAKGGLIASTWFLKGQTTSTIKCQPTPGGNLAKRLNKALNPEGKKERTHVVEEGGLPVTATLRRTDPFHPGTCRFQDPDCIVETGKDCAQTGCIYEITCTS